MTKMQTPCSVNHSVSPSMTTSAAPVYGADANPQEIQGDHGEHEVALEVPENVEKVEIERRGEKGRRGDEETASGSSACGAD